MGKLRREAKAAALVTKPVRLQVDRVTELVALATMPRSTAVALLARHAEFPIWQQWHCRCSTETAPQKKGTLYPLSSG